MIPSLTPSNDPGWNLFREGGQTWSQEKNFRGRIAATDGSLKKNAEGIKVMGAGVYWYDTKLGTAIQVKGHGSTLLAEGAAMIEALRACNNEKELMIFTDSKNVVLSNGNSLLADFAACWQTSTWTDTQKRICSVK